VPDGDAGRQQEELNDPEAKEEETPAFPELTPTVNRRPFRAS
jgi:hypothetical protein